MYRFNTEKITLQRSLRNTRSLSPINNFFGQLELIENLYFEIEKNIESHKLIQQARRQLVISLVSALEVYFKDLLMQSYDSGVFENSYLVKVMNRRFLLSDIKNIIDNKFTVGEILASIFTFNNLKSVNKVFSGLIGMNFFKELNDFEFELKSPVSDDGGTAHFTEKTTLLTEDRRIYSTLKELYSLRPFITHDQPEKSSISEFQVHYFLSAVGLFTVVVDDYLNTLIGKMRSVK